MLTETPIHCRGVTVVSLRLRFRLTLALIPPKNVGETNAAEAHVSGPIRWTLSLDQGEGVQPSAANAPCKGAARPTAWAAPIDTSKVPNDLLPTA